MPPESASAMATSSDNSDAIAYLISSATQQVKEGQYAFARCYLLTASELAPDNFLIKVCLFIITIIFTYPLSISLITLV